MRYPITIYNTPESTAAITERPDDQRKNHDAIQKALRASGELLDTDVGSTTDAGLVAARDGQINDLPVPYTHGDEIAGGYHLVECVNGERALEIAHGFFETGLVPIEVRQLVG